MVIEPGPCVSSSPPQTSAEPIGISCLHLGHLASIADFLKQFDFVSVVSVFVLLLFFPLIHNKLFGDVEKHCDTGNINPRLQKV